ncbi:MAG: octanoyltransferase [Gammaproteobacteria bacterium RIFCSPHIGHO2_12_FULL_41_20]|nr:MAG: octanoyltransferase [Gammaproteobacteria bacterium RIFCSPHIGHO2_12_FULL_41_20]
MPIKDTVIVRLLGQQDYLSCWHRMKQFTSQRSEQSIDEVWLLEHPPVFTQGQNGQAKHILDPQDIPVIHTDRGGQVTYHGPGQLIVYTLIDLYRKKLSIRDIVTQLENTAIALLAQYQINAFAKRKAPGVYVKMDTDEKKIASIGLRVRHGRSYHGLALNVNMNLAPYAQINPCGYANLGVTQLADLKNDKIDTIGVGLQLINILNVNLGYTQSVSLLGV